MDVSEMMSNNILLEIYRNRSEMEACITRKDTGEFIDRVPVHWRSRQNKLDYLSVSKIQSYEQCPACFYLEYLSDETVHVDNSNYFTKFGTIMHAVVEGAMRYYRDNGVVVNPIELLNEVWQDGDLQGFADYNQMVDLITGYFKRYPVDDRPDVPVLIEEEWRGELGGVTFGLMIDYAGRIGEDICILRDYKTNRMPFKPNELQDSLQLRVYMLVIKRHYAHLFEGVKKWLAEYDLFFHERQRCPEWSDDDLKRAEDYVHNIAVQIENDNVWEERINNYCQYRECRHKCEAYKKLMKEAGDEIASVKLDGTSIDEVERLRVRMQAIEKNAKGRVDECNKILKAEIERMAKMDGKLIADGKELSLYSNPTSSYRYEDTKNVLLVNNKLGLLDGCLSISKTKFDQRIKSDPNLKLQLASCMQTNYASPYIVAKKAK